MKSLPTVHSCATKEDLLRHVDQVMQGIAEFLREIPEDQLTTPGEPEGWSAARNIRHCAKTNRLMARWIGMPAFLLKLFGRPGRPHLRIEDLSATNRPGITDYGIYPKSQAPAGLKEDLIREFLTSGENLKNAVEKRSETDLDQRRGLWGGMSLRVFTLFALKHAVHHIGVARNRLGGR